MGVKLGIPKLTYFDDIALILFTNLQQINYRIRNRFSNGQLIYHGSPFQVYPQKKKNLLNELGHMVFFSLCD
jgi:hypothetical protein